MHELGVCVVESTRFLGLFRQQLGKFSLCNPVISAFKWRNKGTDGAPSTSCIWGRKHHVANANICINSKLTLFTEVGGSIWLSSYNTSVSGDVQVCIPQSGFVLTSCACSLTVKKLRLYFLCSCTELYRKGCTERWDICTVYWIPFILGTCLRYFRLLPCSFDLPCKSLRGAEVLHFLLRLFFLG